MYYYIFSAEDVLKGPVFAGFQINNKGNNVSAGEQP